MNIWDLEKIKKEEKIGISFSLVKVLYKKGNLTRRKTEGEISLASTNLPLTLVIFSH